VSQVIAHAAALAMIAAQGWSVLALWLRLRWGVREEHAHHQYLVAVVRTLPPGSRIQERRADGSSLMLTVAHANACEEEDG
jgi:hypothetical protein